MTDTPRTDEQINGKPCTRFAVLAGDSLRDALIPAQFARQLERELASQKVILDGLLNTLKVLDSGLMGDMNYEHQCLTSETGPDAMTPARMVRQAINAAMKKATK